MNKRIITVVFFWGNIIFLSCQKKSNKTNYVKLYTSNDSVFVSDYFHFCKIDFNRIVDSFPNLHQYPYLHPDSCFAMGPTYIKWKNDKGYEEYIDFDISDSNQSFYDLYTYFTSKHNSGKYHERRRLQNILYAMSSINNIINYSGQENIALKLKVPSLVEYALYQSKTWQSKQNKFQFENEKKVYFDHLKATIDQKMNPMLTTTVEFKSASKRINTYFLQMQQCNAFEFEQLRAYKEDCFKDEDLEFSTMYWGEE